VRPPIFISKISLMDGFLYATLKGNAIVAEAATFAIPAGEVQEACTARGPSIAVVTVRLSCPDGATEPRNLGETS
jgi:hypothetical protein